MSATVIIPTTGSRELYQAIESVLKQTYPTTCYVVADGLEYVHTVKMTIKSLEYKNIDTSNIKLCNLPINVGAKGFYGHRVYAAFSHLVNEEYVLFLDQDCWFDNNHVGECVVKIKQKNLDWSYSLRKIVDKEGNFLFNDDCDSLGEYPSWKYGQKFVDMNCYLFKNCVISQTAHVLFDLVRTYDGDKNLFKEVSNRFPNFAGTGKYTVNYRMTRPNQEDWYREGNEIIRKQYSLNFPWSNNDN